MFRYCRLLTNVCQFQLQLTKGFNEAVIMSQDIGKNKNKVYKVVLTGGPCGGKTTGQARLSTFFESLGWKVYRAPETALVLMRWSKQYMKIPKNSLKIPKGLSAAVNQRKTDNTMVESKRTKKQTDLQTLHRRLKIEQHEPHKKPEMNPGGGIKFTNLTQTEAYKFQENLIRTMKQIEDTYFELADSCQQNCLVICDRGIMDASAYLARGDWEKMKADNGWNEVHLRDNRYNQVIHMVSAARGAEVFYTVAGHQTRHECISQAVDLDKITAGAWVGHPYFDVIDNQTGFEDKVMRMISAVCNRLGIDTGDRLSTNSKKRKFLVKCILDWEQFPAHQNFIVNHDYLVTPSRKMQARIRRRGQNGQWTYTHTIRRPEINEQSVELRMAINSRDYGILLAQRDDRHYTIYKKRTCFLWNNHYFHLDQYEEPCPNGCKGLILLETYTTREGGLLELPDFLEIDTEVTGNSKYSMFNLSLKEEMDRIKSDTSLDS